MKTKRLVILALMTSLAIILGFVESLLPIPFPIPGAKLGIANIVTLFCLYKLGIKDTVIVLFCRIFLSTFLFTSLSSVMYSLAGAFFSLSTMILFKRFKFNLIIVGITGGIMHNFGQLIAASLIVNSLNLFISYFPYLTLLGFLTGLFVGISTNFFIQHIKNIDFFRKGME